MLSVGCLSHSSSDSLIHHEYVSHRYAFPNANKLDTVYKAKNCSWQGLHNAIATEKNRELFDTDFMVQVNSAN